jgi:hypothetical protein
MVVVPLFAAAARADETCEAKPAKLRYDDTVDCVRDDDRHRVFPSALKRIPLGDGEALMSFGGEVRQRYEYTDDPALDGAPQDDTGVWLQRYVLHAELRLSRHFRIFGQLSSALEEGRDGAPIPVEENHLALQNAFIDLSFALAEESELTLRAGRQELLYGSGRLVDVREGPNVRRTFDAARAIVESSGWRVDGFAARPQVARPGTLDDEASDEESLWGVYATSAGGFDLVPSARLDFYYLGFRDDVGTFVQGTAKERRHSLGARLWGSADGWDWNWEALYQIGSFGDGEIRAWTLASETGFTFDTLPWRPRISLSANVASGDDDATDEDLGTFNAMFPRGNYFSEAAVVGPRNFFNVHPFVTVNPIDAWSLTTDVNFFWRLETDDGVYAPSGALVRAPNGSEARFVGTALSVKSVHELADHLTFTANYERFLAGDFMDETGGSPLTQFFQLTVQFKF